MKFKVLGVLVAVAGVLLLSACGNDNDWEAPFLVRAISATATSLTVSQAQGFPATGGTIQIDAEWLGYAGRDGTRLTGLIRGVEGTTPMRHEAHAVIWFRSSEIPEEPTDTPVPMTSTPTIPQGPTYTPTVTPTPGGAVCGDGEIEGTEQCDDGNVFGGDGCAANCTNEVVANFPLGCIDALETAGEGSGAADEGEGKLCSGALVQPIGMKLPFKGGPGVILGQPRHENVTTTDPSVKFKADQIPITVRAEDIHVDPIVVPGFGCACVRGVEQERFGPGNAGAGLVGCNEEGLDEVNYVFKVDHNVTPDHPNNGGGLPDDPDCENGFLEDGSPLHPHAGVCNSRPVLKFTGKGPRGSAVVPAALSISLIWDGGKCAEEDCAIEGYGPDCVPCTDDDPDQGEASVMPTTTGTAKAVVYDAGNQPGTKLEYQVSGAPVDCDALLADPEHPDLSGMAFVDAFGLLDNNGMDVVTLTVFAAGTAEPKEEE